MIAFLGSSHAAQHLKDAALKRGVPVSEDPHRCDVIFVSEDTPIDPQGHRVLGPIHDLIGIARTFGKPIVLTSQVPPGFTRSLGIDNIYHQAETLRIKDAAWRAYNPDYIVIGVAKPSNHELPEGYLRYLYAFQCPLPIVSYEEAEFSKIAVNMMLAAQVDATNRLAAAATRCGASWTLVANILKMDKRIGEEAYLEPGRWQDSKHLMRDDLTLEEISTR